MMKNKMLFIVLATMLITFSAYGGHEGNGGDVVVCMKDQASFSELRKNLIDNFNSPVELKQDPFRGGLINKISAPPRMLDLWRVDSLREFSGSWEKEFESIKIQLSKWSNLDEVLSTFEEQTQWEPSSSGVLQISDSNHKTPVDNNCLIVQMAYQDWISSNFQIVYYDQRLWQLMTSKDRLALRLHEPLARIERKSLGRDDTVKTRLTVQWLLDREFYNRDLKDYTSFQKTIDFLTSYLKACYIQERHVPELEKSLSLCANHRGDIRYILPFTNATTFYDFLGEKSFRANIPKIEFRNKNLSYHKEKILPLDLYNAKYGDLTFKKITYSSYNDHGMVTAAEGVLQQSGQYHNLKIQFPESAKFSRKGSSVEGKFNYLYIRFGWLVDLNIKKDQGPFPLTDQIQVVANQENIDKPQIYIFQNIGSEKYQLKSQGNSLDYIVNLGADEIICQSIVVDVENRLKKCKLKPGQLGSFTFLPQGLGQIEIAKLSFSENGLVKQVTTSGSLTSVDVGGIKCNLGDGREIKLNKNLSVYSCSYASGNYYPLGEINFSTTRSSTFYPTGQLRSVDLNDYDVKSIKVGEVVCTDTVWVYENGGLTKCTIKKSFRVKIRNSKTSIQAESDSSISFHENGAVKSIYAKRSFRWNGKKYPGGRHYKFDASGKLQE